MGSLFRTTPRIRTLRTHDDGVDLDIDLRRLRTCAVFYVHKQYGIYCVYVRRRAKISGRSRCGKKCVVSTRT